LPSLNDPHTAWFAIYVKSRHEKNIALALENKGYETYLPTYLKFDERRRKFELPLFPNYVFCRFETLMPLPILTTPGVFSIVCNGCVPAPIPQVEIEGVRRLVGMQLTPHPWPYLSPGQTVRLNSGPFRGIQGVVLDDSQEKWLVISVHVLRRSVAVKIDRASLDGLILRENTDRSSVIETTF
jgi:transcription termination/antitermination protein NusG